MNIESTTIKTTQDTAQTQPKAQNSESDVKFSDELKNVKEENSAAKTDNAEKPEKPVEEKDAEVKETSPEEKISTQEQPKENIPVQEEDVIVAEAFNSLLSLVDKFNKPDIEVGIEKNENFTPLNQNKEQLLGQTEDKKTLGVKNILNAADNNNEQEDEGINLINNDFNIQENKDILPQMNPNMNFGGDGQPFSSFMNNEAAQQGNQGSQKLAASAKDLAEEAAILSTMAENIAMANKANVEEPAEKIVNRNDGIKKVDTHTGVTKETIVKYDSVIMNEADVEVFANLVQNGEVDMNNLAPEAAQKSVHVSKTLADMLAKAMEDNKPIRIDFDNNISVIIKISRDGKLTADFLPSSQVAEAYLKENLPLLKQRFDEQNIDYDKLNQRERRNREQDDNRKKGRENE